MEKITFKNFPYKTTPLNDANLNQLQTNVENALEDLYYKSGDVFKFTNRVPLVALVTSGTTRLYISIPVEKSLANINSIVCNSFQAEIRGLTGYLNSESGFIEYVNREGYTITCEKGTDNIIRVLLDKSTAWTNTSNNTPVIVMLNESSSFSFI